MDNFRYINLDYLSLMAGGEDEMMAVMLQMLVDELPTELELCKQHYGNREYKQLKEVSHKLKSTLSFVGYDAMTEVNMRIEQNAKEEMNIEEIEVLLQQLEACYGQVKPELEYALNKYL